MTGARESRICRDRHFGDSESLHLDQGRKEAMRAFKKFHMLDAFAFEDAISAAGICDVFAGKFIAHPISDPGRGNPDPAIPVASCCYTGPTDAVRIF